MRNVDMQQISYSIANLKCAQYLIWNFLTNPTPCVDISMKTFIQVSIQVSFHLLHIIMTINQTNMKCLICNLNFATKSNLKTHEESAHKLIKKFCPDCGKEFSGKSNFSTHINKSKSWTQMRLEIFSVVSYGIL